MNTLTVTPAELIAQAIAVRQNAYVPYSHYSVGAALLADDGHVYTGCNVENAAYPLTLCAERAAVVAAIAAGAHAVLAIAVVTENGGSPCGACRQVLREFGAPETPVYIATTTGDYRTHTLGELLPESFTATDLPAC